MNKKKFKHISVLLNESIDGLNIIPNGIYIDGTYGTGGHSKLILSKLNKNGRLIAIDRDPYAVHHAQNTVFDKRFTIKCILLSELESFIKEIGLIGKINGIILDFGISSSQLDDPKRGFSFLHDGPLDMRMNPNIGQSAYDWLMCAKEHDISWVLKTYGEEYLAKKIAKKIIFQRNYSIYTSLKTTKQLADLIKKIIPYKKNHKHPATKSFQAIRIHINNELEEIKSVLKATLNMLAPLGRMSIISFHSLEDRLVKQFIKNHSEKIKINNNIFFVNNNKIKTPNKPILKMLGKKKPTQKEIINNPRSRSSIVRFAEILK